MLKRLVAWKYGIAVVVILGGSIYVSRQDQKTRALYEQKCNQLNASAASQTPHYEDCDKGAENAAGHLPRWYRVFGWPEAVTTWAILLTLFTVAEQTMHTARAADAANKTLISTLRPKLIIRKIDIHRGTQIPVFGQEDADPWRVDFEFANVGQGAAHILEHEFAISRLDTPLPPKITYMQGSREPFSLEPGEDRQLSIVVDENLMNTLRMIGVEGLRLGYQNTGRIYFFGIAKYADDLGIKRNISACRRYDNATTIFKPVDDPDREYSD